MTTVVAKIDSRSAIDALNKMIVSDETLVLVCGEGNTLPQVVVLQVEFGGGVKQNIRLYASGKWEMNSEIDL